MYVDFVIFVVSEKLQVEIQYIYNKRNFIRSILIFCNANLQTYGNTKFIFHLKQRKMCCFFFSFTFMYVFKNT